MTLSNSKLSNIKQPLNDRLLKALRREPIDRTPIWIMRQAGRYLPEYRAIRKKTKDFLNLCKTPSLAAEVTLQPMARFDLDAAIIFSDILTVPDAMGLGLYFVEGEGPCFKTPIRLEQQINDLPIVDPELELAYVLDAIRLCKQAINNQYPLIGFAGSPFTVACYMIEGKGSKTFNQVRKMMYSEANLFKRLLQKVCDNTILYLTAQIKAGANCIIVFDTWGGILPELEYQIFSLSYMNQIVKALNLQFPNTAITLFSKNSGLYLKAQAASGCQGLGLDWTANIQQARLEVGHQVALQGNLDPAVLYAKPQEIISKVESVFSAYGTGSGHIFNLGHGIYPDIDFEKVKILIDAVHSISPKYH